MIIAEMDASENEIKSVELAGYPTFKFFPANNKNFLTYDTDKDFFDFLQDHTRYLHPNLTLLIVLSVIVKQLIGQCMLTTINWVMTMMMSLRKTCENSDLCLEFGIT